MCQKATSICSLIEDGGDHTFPFKSPKSPLRDSLALNDDGTWAKTGKQSSRHPGATCCQWCIKVQSLWGLCLGRGLMIYCPQKSKHRSWETLSHRTIDKPVHFLQNKLHSIHRECSLNNVPKGKLFVAWLGRRVGIHFLSNLKNRSRPTVWHAKMEEPLAFLPIKVDAIQEQHLFNDVSKSRVSGGHG
jgi:hypothetical protein